MKKLFTILTACLCVSSMWAAAGDEIKSVSNIASGKSYYLKGVWGSGATNNVVYFGPTESDESESDVKVQSTPVSDILEAMPITFTQVTGGWTLTTPNGMYLRPHSSNGQSYFCKDEVILTISAGNTKEGNNQGILIGGYNVTKSGTTTEWKFQMNKTANKMGGYSSVQYAITLIEVDETKTETSLEFGEYEQSININESFTEPTLTADPTSILSSVTYSGNNDAVATVNATTGALTFTGVDGEIKVTASFAGDETYKASSASYTLTVVDPSKLTATFALETNPYEWTATSNNETFYDGTTYAPAVEGAITLTSEGKVRMWLSSSKNSLRLYDDDADYSVGAITLSAAGATITSIKLEGTNMTFTSTVGNLEMAQDKSYSVWSGEATSVKLTKGSNTPQIKTITVTYVPIVVADINVSSAEYATYYNSESAYIMPEGLEGITVTGVAGNALTLTTSYVAGDVVPAGEALILHGASGPYTLYAGETSNPVVAGNKLKGTSTADELTTGNDGDVFYRLSQHGTEVGFYWGAEDGAEFAPGANKAYLAVPASAGAPERFVFGQNPVATGVENMASVKATKALVNGQLVIVRNGAKFNLNGMLVK